MKKALVIACTLLMGFGLASFGAGALSGVWDTDVSLYPAASVFTDFVKSFTSEVDVDYSIGGWVFGMESTFGVAGLTGMDFEADGSLGAFTFGFDIDFAPMVVLSTTTTLVDCQTTTSTVACCPESFPAITCTKSDKKTYKAAFDDMLAEVGVSIAGVTFDGVFFMEGHASEANATHTSWYFTQTPSYTVGGAGVGVCEGTAYQCTEYDTTVWGTGWKFQAAGTFSGATLTGRAYFNLSETSTYDENSGDAAVYLVDHFTKSGSYSIACQDCVMRFSSAELLIEDLSFACVSLKALAVFDCCGFQDVKFLLEDIGLGCCWDLGFDMMITFDTDSKSIELEPTITLSNACFTIIAAVSADTAYDDFELQGIDILGIGLAYSWNGISFEALASFDIALNPIKGDWGSGTIYGGASFCVLEPDRCWSYAEFEFSNVDACTDSSCDTVYVHPVLDENGGGYFVLKTIDCERAKAWESFKITIDGDSCCGGAFDISAAFYLGELEVLSDLDGIYWADADADEAYELLPGVEYWVFYGDKVPDADDVPSLSTFSDSCAMCSSPGDVIAYGNHGGVCSVDGYCCSQEYDEVKWYKTWTAKTDNRLFDWIETEVDVELGVGPAFVLTFGMDIDAWGWEEFNFGFEFTF